MNRLRVRLVKELCIFTQNWFKINMISNAGCIKCDLCKTRKTIVNGSGDPSARIFIIGEGPGLKEDVYGQPFVGPAGTLLKRLLLDAGIDHRTVFMSGVVRCIPKGTTKVIREPTYEEIEACVPYLEQEIAAVKPTIIVPCGNTALRYILEAKNINITSKRGLEIWSEKYKCKVMPIFHPAAIVRNPKYESVTTQDLVRIKSSSATKELSVLGMGDYKIADTPEKLNELFKYLESEPEIAIDLETTGLDWLKSDIISVGFSWKERTGWCLPFLKSKLTEEEPTVRFWDDATFLKITTRLKKALALPSKKIFHHGKFDLKHLEYNGFKVANVYFDTMLAHHLLDENAENLHGLKDCAWVYTDMGGYDKEVSDWFVVNKKLKGQYIMLPFNILTKYNAADADCTFRLFKVFEPLMIAQGLTRIYKQIINPATAVLLQTELTGVQVDTAYIEKLRIEYTIKKGDLENQIYSTVGTFNINSAKELRNVLYEQNKFRTSRTTKKGAMSTDRATLTELADTYSTHAVPKLLLQYRETSKMLSTFIEGLAEWLDKDGRIHSTYKQHGTVTGRLSSAEPNLQNIPRDSAIRGIFIAKPGHTLIEADYGQAEFRFWALYSQDPQMISDIASGKDIHKMTAASAFGVSLESVTKKQRQDAKAIVFGLMYGRGTWSVAQQLGMSEDDAEKVVQIFFSRYPKAKRWLKDTVDAARRNGYVKNHFGRIRRLPGINSSDELVRSEAERQSKNSPIQSGASDMTMIAGVRIKKKFESIGFKSQLVLTVHDSVIYEVPDAEVVESTRIIKEEIERPIEGINVPMSAEIKIGHRWGALDEISFKPTGEYYYVKESKVTEVKVA
jgi:uracil-DNA glycosylase family 4